jgi:phosphatidylserine/phosphatidylglycerophosphate/cardiolipin synthase-like enzyme
MRHAVEGNGVAVKAYAGTTGVLVAMNVEAHKREGLLGFALQRRKGGAGEAEWLMGMLPFPDAPHKPGELIPTNVAPIQKFRWSDYRVFPDTRYDYTAHPVYGSPQQPEVEDGPTVSVTTAGRPGREHFVLFNRAAAASQAFSRKFPDLEQQLNDELRAAEAAGREPRVRLPDDALAWLSRGVLEQIVGFIERARDESWGLDIAIYEYELLEIVQAVEAAHARGVDVRIVFHAKVGDDQTAANEHSLAGLPATVKRARLTKKICHHKFIVLSRRADGNRTPLAVLCGSTNFTENGVFRQANVVHTVERADLAGTYLGLFEVLFGGADTKATRQFINTNNPFNGAGPLFAGFSPRSGGGDLRGFIELVNSARRDVLFCTAFDLNDDLEDALLGAPHDPILRYGLENSRSRISGVHADRTASFAASAMLNRGLEGFLKETTKGQRGNILIHTKLIVVDFTSDAPTVISGSHNFSRSASEGNDENYLVVRGDTDLADAYGCELMRLYDHYRFRFVIRGRTEAGQPAHARTLKSNDSWTDPYFERDSLKYRDRLRFVGRAG